MVDSMLQRGMNTSLLSLRKCYGRCHLRVWFWLGLSSSCHCASCPCHCATHVFKNFIFPGFHSLGGLSRLVHHFYRIHIRSNLPGLWSLFRLSVPKHPKMVQTRPKRRGHTPRVWCGHPPHY